VTLKDNVSYRTRTRMYVCVGGRGYVTYIAFVVAEVDAQHGHGANNGDQ